MIAREGKLILDGLSNDGCLGDVPRLSLQELFEGGAKVRRDPRADSVARIRFRLLGVLRNKVKKLSFGTEPFAMYAKRLKLPMKLLLGPPCSLDDAEHFQRLG